MHYHGICAIPGFHWHDASWVVYVSCCHGDKLGIPSSPLSTSYVPSVDGFFRGSIYIQMRPANRMTTLNVFSSALEDFKRFYINSPVQRAVSRTEYATVCVEPI